MDIGDGILAWGSAIAVLIDSCMHGRESELMGRFWDRGGLAAMEHLQLL